MIAFDLTDHLSESEEFESCCIDPDEDDKSDIEIIEDINGALHVRVLGESVEADVERAQKKKWYAYEPSTEEVEVILDSGADCHVLSMQS